MIVALSFCCPGLGHFCSDRIEQGRLWLVGACLGYLIVGWLGLAIHAACVIVTAFQKLPETSAEPESISSVTGDAASG